MHVLCNNGRHRHEPLQSDVETSTLPYGFYRIFLQLFTVLEVIERDDTFIGVHRDARCEIRRRFAPAFTSLRAPFFKQNFFIIPFAIEFIILENFKSPVRKGRPHVSVIRSRIVNDPIKQRQ